MPESLFHGVFDAALISPAQFLLCLGTALGLGIVLAGFFSRSSRCSRSFLVTLALLPSVVCVTILMVNGNVGTGVAVAGAFSLVRFRSAPGTAREITVLFLAMAAGLITGMGYLAFAVLFVLLLCPAMVLLDRLSLRLANRSARTMTITIPEDLDYTDVFDDIFRRYTRTHELVRVKTTNLGSLFRLTYDLTLSDPAEEKQMLDQLRCRNGNLEITISPQQTTSAEL